MSDYKLLYTFIDCKFLLGLVGLDFCACSASRCKNHCGAIKYVDR